MGVNNVHFSGGEPFLFPDFHKLLTYASKKVPNITIYTNGALIDEEWIKKIRKLDSQVTLLFKFDSPHTYEKHTGSQGTFEKVMGTMKKFVESDLTVIAFITLTKYNIKYLVEMINNAVDLGAYPILERYMAREHSTINKELEITEGDWKKALSFSMELYKDLSKDFEETGFMRKGLCSCYRDLIAITHDGHVLPCPFLPLKTNLGNIKEKPLNEIWKNYETKRKDWLRTPDSCVKCKFVNMCGGGCKAYTFLKHGNVSKKDPFCNREIPPNYCHIGFIAANKGLKIEKLST
jgi:radical SAM protein with 4Fe4S-binding SPASM domain